ncbi:MAG: zf-TFIIB domain-containing protein, partial [Bradymonadaceae bacterium]
MTITRHCPHCRSPLDQRQSHGVEVDLCGQCGGLWLDEGEFDALIAQRFAGKSLEDTLDQTAAFPERCRFCNLDQSGRESCQNCGLELGINCPVDHSSMYIVSFGDIELDRCGECRGIWIDGFEREALARGDWEPPVEEVFPDVVGAAEQPLDQNDQVQNDWGTAPDWSGGDEKESPSPTQPLPALQRPVTKTANLAAVAVVSRDECETFKRYTKNLEETCAGCEARMTRYA